ncbi:hypothetical protein CKO51_31995 [Rhodopirellula sp. SM50]|nr:hypothetical protein CKO51_31995 [Rhodopirellula sp. SM50]
MPPEWIELDRSLYGKAPQERRARQDPKSQIANLLTRSESMSARRLPWQNADSPSRRDDEPHRNSIDQNHSTQ